MRSRLLLTAGLALAGVLHGAVTGQIVVPALALAVALGAVVAGPRISLPQAAQALVLVATGGATLAVALIDVPLAWQEGGPKLQYVVLSGTALLTVATRLWLHDPERGHPVTWVIGLVAYVCCGRVGSELYLPLVVAYLALAWLHQAWRPRGLEGLALRHVAAGVALVTATAATATGATVGLRKVYQALEGVVFADGGSAAVGFGAGSFRLGSMDGMRDSDEVILRVHGPSPEHFRGQAYSEYGHGFWLPPSGDTTPVARGRVPGQGATVIDFVSDEQERLFLPPGAAAVVVEPIGAEVDALGIPRLGDGSSPRRVRLDTGGTQRFPSPPPTPADLEVPPDVAAAIGPLVQGWVAGIQGAAERVAQIERRLEQDYTYSLHYERDAVGDPVVQFLLTSRLGHCEYFATAQALASRSVGVPARVITGFRSIELSPFGGHRIVRSRDAHAWVEVWLDGGWVTVDPSPENAVAATFAQGATDDLALLWERYGLQSLAAVLLLVFVGLQVRTLLRGRRPRAAPVDGAWIEGPPAYLAPLLAVLSQQALDRRPDEAVEAFAGRAEEAGCERAGALLRRYAALRYGGVGDPLALNRDVAAWRAAAGDGAAE